MGRASFIDPLNAPQTILPGDELTLEKGVAPRIERKDDRQADPECHTSHESLASLFWLFPIWSPPCDAARLFWQVLSKKRPAPCLGAGHQHNSDA